MSRSLPYIVDGRCYSPDASEASIAVGTPRWFDWLGEQESFAFRSAEGSFTARRSKSGRYCYWKAYRRLGGRLASVHLGRGDALTLARLTDAARKLADRGMAPIEGRGVTPPKPEPVAAPPNLSPGLRDTLALTKFFMPTPHPERVTRPALLARLRNDARDSLVLIVAPAGYGKTTFLTDWIETDARRAAWISVEPADNDPARFWLAVAVALDRVQPGMTARTLRVLEGTAPPPAAVAVPMLLSDLATTLAEDERGRPTLLVLDDYHLIESRAIHDTMATFLERLPSRLRLVIASRTEPVLPIARLRARGQLAEVRATDLALDPGEVADYSARAGIALDPALATILAERTEGWAAGLHLAILALRGRGDHAAFVARFQGTDRHIAAFLTEEVLLQQPPVVREFLLRTAILERMCAPLCDAICGTPGGAAQMLSYLELRGLFVVALDEEGRWYRYHHLFSGLLRHRLRTEHPGLDRQLRREAAAWLTSAGRPLEAAAQAIAAEDWPTAATLIEPLVGGAEAFRRGTTAAHWLAALPEPVIRGSTPLALALGMVLIHSGQYDAAAAWATALARDWGRPDAAGIGTLDRTRLRAQWAYIRYLIDEDQESRAGAIADATAALATLPEDDLDWRMVAAVALAQLLYHQGRLIEANAAYATSAGIAARLNYRQAADAERVYEALTLIDRGRLGAGEAILRAITAARPERPGDEEAIFDHHSFVVAHLHYERDELDAAREAIARAIASPDILASSVAPTKFVCQARIALATGDRALAAYALSEAARHFPPAATADELARAPRQAAILGWRALLLLAEGDLDGARRAIAPVERAIDLASFPVGPWLYRAILTASTQIRLLQGDAPGALDLLERWRPRIEATDAGLALLRLLALRSVALEQVGDSGAARATLTAAIAQAAPESAIAAFLEAGPALLSPLQGLLRSATLPTEVRRHALRLLEACAARHGTTPAPAPARMRSEHGAATSPLIEPLSARETEVLHLIAAGCANEEIAARLFVSTSTVKWHVRQIHQKLGVERRTQAVARARDLALLR